MMKHRTFALFWPLAFPPCSLAAARKAAPSRRRHLASQGPDASGSISCRMPAPRTRAHRGSTGGPSLGGQALKEVARWINPTFPVQAGQLSAEGHSVRGGCPR